MDNQKLPSLIPDKYKERFLIKRIDEKDIEITIDERDAILVSLERGIRFIQIGKYTLMLNSIKSIDPLWGEDNIPPRPAPAYEALTDGSIRTINQAEIDEWDKIFNYDNTRS